MTIRTPDGKTPMGVCVWLVPGTDQALAWSGEWDMLRRRTVITRGDGALHLGAPFAAVSGRLTSLADAQAAAGAWIDGARGDNDQTGTAAASG